MARDWCRYEVEAIVDDYLSMLAAERSGIPYVKSSHSARLMSLLDNRSGPSIEFKHANISAALIEAGFPYIEGYKPCQPTSGTGQISIEQLVTAVRALGTRRAEIGRDFGATVNDDRSLRDALEVNPIAAWTGGAGMGGVQYFAYEAGAFSTTSAISDVASLGLRGLARELMEWRLAEYLDRQSGAEGAGYVINVMQARNGAPILMPLDRARYPGLPEGWTPFVANGRQYQGNFVRVALNVAKSEGTEKNELPETLRTWFGPKAGAPGTRHRVMLIKNGDAWELEPSRLSDAETGSDR